MEAQKNAVVMKCQCPCCDKDIRLAKINTTPKENDICICTRCGTILTFNEELKLRRISALEISAIQVTYPVAYVKMMSTSNNIKTRRAAQLN